jgi:hypothetical protein
VSPKEASALTGIGLTSIREAISSSALKNKKHGRRTIILPDACKPIKEKPRLSGLLFFGGAVEPTDGWEQR